MKFFYLIIYTENSKIVWNKYLCNIIVLASLNLAMGCSHFHKVLLFRNKNRPVYHRSMINFFPRHILMCSDVARRNKIFSFKQLKKHSKSLCLSLPPHTLRKKGSLYLPSALLSDSQKAPLIIGSTQRKASWFNLAQTTGLIPRTNRLSQTQCFERLNPLLFN